LLLCVVFLLASCADAYGAVGGADITDTHRKPGEIAYFVDAWEGGWYARNGVMLLDGYVFGRWKTVSGLGLKLHAFPGFNPAQPRFVNSQGQQADAVPADDAARGSPGTIHPDDYFVMFDDTVYGLSSTDNDPGSPGYSYLAIIRGVNIFDRNEGHGALVVEYLAGCYPARYPFAQGGAVLPFYGIFFRAVSERAMKLENPIKLADRLNGKPYYTETATLVEAFSQSNVENDAEFVDWAEAAPREMESCRE
jgi:hypothetical protein